jgi:hypothetical protein
MANNISVVAALLREVPETPVDEILEQVDLDVGAFSSFAAMSTGDPDNHGGDVKVMHWQKMAQQLQQYGAALLALGKAMEPKRAGEARH